MRRLVAQAEALCRAVAPDVADGPLYVLLDAELPAELRAADGPAGYTTRHLDLILRPTLERRGRWRGRGPAMVVVPDALAAGLGHLTRPARRRGFIPEMLGTVLHELAHVLDLGPSRGPEPSANFIRFAALALEAELHGVTEPTNGPRSDVPWHRHEAAFIRTAVHLAYRARAQGVHMPPEDVFDATEYGLSPTRRYAAALGDEPARLAGCDFATIRATPPPVAFAELWQADVQRWKSQATPTDELSKTLAACERRNNTPGAAQEAPQGGMEAHVDRTVGRTGDAKEGPRG